MTKLIKTVIPSRLQLKLACRLASQMEQNSTTVLRSDWKVNQGSVYFKQFPAVIVNRFWSWCKRALIEEVFQMLHVFVKKKKKKRKGQRQQRYESSCLHTQIRVLLWTHAEAERLSTDTDTYSLSLLLFHSLSLSLSSPSLLHFFLPLTSGLLAGHGSCVVCVHISRGLSFRAGQVRAHTVQIGSVQAFEVWASRRRCDVRPPIPPLSQRRFYVW